jgi:AraC-like DNA-binding protein
MTLPGERQMLTASRPVDRPRQADTAGDAGRRRSGMPRPTKLVRLHPILAGIVDQIVDWDFPDGDMARALTPKALPSTTPYLIAQYRVPMRSYRRFGSTDYQHRQYGHVATAIGTGVVTVRPSGPLGALIVSLKPEATAHLMGERMQEFVNEKIDLGCLFKIGELSLLEEMLMEAPDSTTRFARIESFLLRNLRECRPDPVVCCAAQYLRRNPSLRIKRLAARLDVSERHLSRRFRAIFGTSPKQFARVARIEKILAMRSNGSAWADIAHACGFADQAHMINDFGTIVGESPQQVFHTTGTDIDCERSTPTGRSTAPSFVWY